MDFKYAIFDFDGTLVDSMKYWRTIAKYVLEMNGYPVPDELFQKSRYMMTYDGIDYLKEELNVTTELQGDKDSVLEAVLAPAYKTEIQMKPYACEYLAYLKENGIKCCIATASERHFIMPAIERLNIGDFFEFIITTTEAGNPKSSPDIFDKAMEKLGGTKANTIVFEDATYTIRTAHTNGYRVYAVADEFSKTEEAEIRQMSEKYIESYKELI